MAYTAGPLRLCTLKLMPSDEFPAVTLICVAWVQSRVPGKNWVSNPVFAVMESPVGSRGATMLAGDPSPCCAGGSGCTYT